MQHSCRKKVESPSENGDVPDNKDQLQAIVMLKNFSRQSFALQFSVLLVMLVATLAVAAWVIGQSLVASRTLNESRSVADMAEHIATWASRYGGVSVRLKGASATSAGTYLERRAYTASSSDMSLLSGARLGNLNQDREAIANMEAYYSKNPALIQREVSDIASTSTSQAKFRITAKTVLNPRNAPTGFEREAIASLETSGAKEYGRASGNQFLYARPLIASQSCLRCHDTPANAPDFIKNNSQFNGGGGFGYVVGRPVGIISVSVPMPPIMKALSENMTPPMWAGLVAPLLPLTLLCIFMFRRIAHPLHRLLINVKTLHRNVAPANSQHHQDTSRLEPGNEVHQLEDALHRLGDSLGARRARPNP